MATFGRQLQAAREAAGLTRVQLGERLGIGQGQIEKIENDRDTPSDERKRRFLAACRAPRPSIASRIAKIQEVLSDQLASLAVDLETLSGDPTAVTPSGVAEADSPPPPRKPAR